MQATQEVLMQGTTFYSQLNCSFRAETCTADEPTPTPHTPQHTHTHTQMTGGRCMGKLGCILMLDHNINNIKLCEAPYSSIELNLQTVTQIPGQSHQHGEVRPWASVLISPQFPPQFHIISETTSNFLNKTKSCFISLDYGAHDHIETPAFLCRHKHD